MINTPPCWNRNEVKAYSSCWCSVRSFLFKVLFFYPGSSLWSLLQDLLVSVSMSFLVLTLCPLYSQPKAGSGFEGAQCCLESCRCQAGRVWLPSLPRIPALPPDLARHSCSHPALLQSSLCPRAPAQPRLLPCFSSWSALVSKRPNPCAGSRAELCSCHRNVPDCLSGPSPDAAEGTRSSNPISRDVEITATRTILSTPARLFFIRSKKNVKLGILSRLLICEYSVFCKRKINFD